MNKEKFSEKSALGRILIIFMKSRAEELH